MELITCQFDGIDHRTENQTNEVFQNPPKFTKDSKTECSASGKEPSSNPREKKCSETSSGQGAR
jgi:hypothetical protein